MSPIRERVFGFTPQTILVLLLGQGGAGTETLAAEPVRMLAETVVTASTVPLDADRVGSAMTVISGEALEQRQIRVVSDALRAVPGLSVNRAGPLGSTTQVRIRGAEANHTLVLIDGVEANDPVSGSLFDFAHLSAYDVERIEILRGPQSALWGSDAIGGVVNIITRRGKAGYQVSGIAEGGAFGTAQTQARVAGAGPRFDWAVSASTLSTDGINISRFGDEDDAFDNTTVQLTSGLQPDEHFEVAASARFTESDRQFDDQDFGAGSPTQGFIVDSDDHTIARQFYGGLQGKARLFDGHWEQAASLGVTRTQNDNFSLGVSSGRSDGEKHKITYRSTFFWDTAPLAPAGHSLTFLVEREKELFSNRGASSPSAEDQDQSTVDYGMVAEYRLDLFDRVSMSGAVRRDLNDRFAHATTYRLTGAYRHAPTGTRVHASLGTGITSPTFFELFGFFPRFFVGNPALTPEASKGWDAGLEQSLLDGRVTIDLTYFEADLRDEIVTIFPPPTFVATVVNQPGESDRRGIEVGANARIYERLGLGANYTFSRATDPGGRDEVRRPRHTGGVTLSYELPNQGGDIALRADYNGEVEDAEFIFSTATDRVELDAFLLVNLSARYRIGKHVTAFGRIENLLDEDYEEIFSFRSPGIGAFVGMQLNWDRAP